MAWSSKNPENLLWRSVPVSSVMLMRQLVEGGRGWGLVDWRTRVILGLELSVPLTGSMGEGEELEVEPMANG